MISNRNVGTVLNETANLLRGALNDPVVVFDIDSTLLFNTSGGQDNQCHGVLYGEVMQLYDFIGSLHLPIFLVTARLDSPEGRQFTRGQLSCLGITGFDGLFMRPSSAGVSVENISDYKLQCRRLITFVHHKNIFLNVGDQWSDHYKCSATKMQELDKMYGDNNVLFKPPADAFSEWSLKLAERNL